MSILEGEQLTCSDIYSKNSNEIINNSSWANFGDLVHKVADPLIQIIENEYPHSEKYKQAKEQLDEIQATYEIYKTKKNQETFVEKIQKEILTGVCEQQREEKTHRDMMQKFKNTPEYNTIQGNEKRIPMIQFLQENGVPNTSKYIILNLLQRNGIVINSLSNTQKERIYNNLQTLIEYITYIETEDGSYKKNTSGSTAEGPIQILSGYKNGKRLSEYVSEKEKAPKYTTFETWLRKYMLYAEGSTQKKKSQSISPDWVKDAYNGNGKITPIHLTPEQTINLFLVATFYKPRNKEMNSHLESILIYGLHDSLEAIYRNHHRGDKKETNARIELANDKFNLISSK